MNNNFNITRLFMTKEVTIFIDDTGNKFNIKVPTIRDFYINDAFTISYNIWVKDIEETKKISIVPVKTSFELVKTIMFELGFYDKYALLSQHFQSVLEQIIPDLEIDFSNKQLKINDITMTEEIWEYFLYVLKLCCGEKVSLPPDFTDEAAKQFYLAQKKNEERIAKLRAKKSDSDNLGKALLSIVYAFPSFTIDYLCEQTMAQIQWLQKYAAGSVSYEVNAKAFAAGNMKKGTKLDFFIK